MTVNSDDVEVLTAALNWLADGQTVILATVVNTWGSSPRPPGSMMVINAAGQFAGSISGGCVEAELVGRVQSQQIPEHLPEWIEFGVDGRQAGRAGLPCGGQLRVLLERLDDAAMLQRLLASLQEGELVARCVDTQSGEIELREGQAGQELSLLGTRLTRTFGPAWHLLLIGNGQIASHLASMALQLDYRVTLCDPREEHQPTSRIDGVAYSRQMPDDAVTRFAGDSRLAVITLAHDPRQDDLALTAALDSRAFYVGALGSSRSAASRLQRLATLGYSEQQLQRIHGPVGLDIGSKRPAEIAVSILAHVTAVRNGRVLS